jgi:hypothetical protein
MTQQLVAAYEDIHAAKTMADYLTSYVDRDEDIKVITSDDRSMFMYVKGQMKRSDELDYNRVLQEGGAIVMVKVDDENAAKVESILNGQFEAVQMDTDTSLPNDYDTYSSQYRQDFDTRYRDSGYTFDHFSPAYQLGHGLASDSRYEQYGWDEIEPSARTFWETNYFQHGAWDDFKDAARHAWQSTRNR